MRDFFRSLTAATMFFALFGGIAEAQSTIDTGAPATQSNLNSLVVRQLATAAASDINGLLSGHPATSLSQCPPSPETFTDCLVVGATPYIWYKFLGGSAGYAEVGTLDPVNGVFGSVPTAPSTNIRGGVFASTAPAHEYASGVGSDGTVIYTRPVAADINDIAGIGLAIDVNGNLDLQPAQTTVLGGVLASAAPTNEFAIGFNASGIEQYTQPQFTNIGGVAAATQGGTGVGSPAANSILVAEGAAPANLLTAATAGRIIIDQGAGVDPEFKAVSGDASIAANGTITVLKTNGVPFGSMATQSAANVAITGGTINGTTIGLTSPAAAQFSSLTDTAFAAAGVVVNSAGGSFGSDPVLPQSLGGTGAATGSAAVLDSISGFSSTGLIERTGAGAYSFISLGTNVAAALAQNGSTPNGLLIPSLLQSGTCNFDIAVDGNGNPILTACGSGGGGGGGTGITQCWTLTPTANCGTFTTGATTLTLSIAPASSGALSIFFNGLRMFGNGISWTISGTTVSFTPIGGIPPWVTTIEAQIGVAGGSVIVAGGSSPTSVTNALNTGDLLAVGTVSAGSGPLKDTGVNLSCTPKSSGDLTTSGSTLNYALPTCNGVEPSWVEVKMNGGGGAGAGGGVSPSGGTGGNGDSTCLNVSTASAACTSPLLEAGGGGGGAGAGGAAGGAGGIVSGSLTPTTSSAGDAGGFAALGTSSSSAQGGAGGGNCLTGGGTAGNPNNTGNSGGPNTGAGGGGGGSQAATSSLGGGGGGGGACIDHIIVSPAAGYTYYAAKTATGGTAGTNGQPGGNGAAGKINFTSHWF